MHLCGRTINKKTAPLIESIATFAALKGTNREKKISTKNVAFYNIPRLDNSWTELRWNYVLFPPLCTIQNFTFLSIPGSNVMLLMSFLRRTKPPAGGRPRSTAFPSVKFSRNNRTYHKSQTYMYVLFRFWVTNTVKTGHEAQTELLIQVKRLFAPLGPKS